MAWCARAGVRIRDSRVSMDCLAQQAAGAAQVIQKVGRWDVRPAPPEDSPPLPEAVQFEICRNANAVLSGEICKCEIASPGIALGEQRVAQQLMSGGPSQGSAPNAC